MDKVFHEFKQVLNYFTPISYLDIGVCKGHAIPFILDILPSLKNIEMIEANRLHEPELQILSKEKNIPFYIEVLSDSVKEIDFFLASNDPSSTGPGNSYYRENTPNFINPIISLITSAFNESIEKSSYKHKIYFSYFSVNVSINSSINLILTFNIRSNNNSNLLSSDYVRHIDGCCSPLVDTIEKT